MNFEKFLRTSFLQKTSGRLLLYIRIAKHQILGFEPLKLQKRCSAKIDHEIFRVFRSCHPEVFCQKVALKNFAKFTGKQDCQVLFWVKLNYATTHHHPPPATTSQNISTTTHYHPPPAKIYLPPATTS